MKDFPGISILNWNENNFHYPCYTAGTALIHIRRWRFRREQLWITVNLFHFPGHWFRFLAAIYQNSPGIIPAYSQQMFFKDIPASPPPVLQGGHGAVPSGCIESFGEWVSAENSTKVTRIRIKAVLIPRRDVDMNEDISPLSISELTEAASYLQ